MTFLGYTEIKLQEKIIYMTFAELVKQLSAYMVAVSVFNDSTAFVSGVFGIKQLLDAPIPDAVYIIKSEELPLISSLKIEKLNLVILGKQTELSEELYRYVANVLFVQNCDNITELFAILNLRMALEQSTHEFMKKLTNALFENEGTQHILDVAYSLIHNPLFTFAKGSGKMEYAANPAVLDSNPVLSDAVRELAAHSFNTIDSITGSGIVTEQVLQTLQSRTSGDMEFHRYENPVFHCDQMISVIKAHGIEVGILVCMAKEHPFMEYDEEYFCRLSTLLSQELQKKSIFTRNRVETKAQFVNYLLGYSGNHHELLYQLERITKLVSLNGRYYVCVLCPPSIKSGTDSVSFDIIAEQLKPYMATHFFVAHDNELVLLFNLKETDKIDEIIDEHIRDLAINNHLTVGISNMFRNLDRTKHMYDQAVRVAALGEKYEAWSVSYFSDMAPIQALHIIQEHDDLLNYCVPEVLDLLEYDKKNDSQLLLTLYVYLEYAGNTNKSASSLYIHKNTMLYRLGKIREILHSDLSSGEDIYKFMQSIRILRILTLVDWSREDMHKLGFL